jgi:antitoxin PrlF
MKMAEAAVTSKGQITIPADIRRAMGLKTKDRVIFTVMPDGTTVMRAKTKSIEQLKGIFKNPTKKKVPISSMRHS